MKPFHAWCADMENSIEDKSEFSKDIPSSKESNNDILQRCYFKAIKSCDIPMSTLKEIGTFADIFTEAFYDEINWQEWDDAYDDQAGIDWFIKLKNKIFTLE
jgi:hypothetical protein